MSLAIDIPADIQAALESKWGELSLKVREELAIDGYRDEILSLAQVRRLLGLATRQDAAEFLGKRGVAVIDFDPAELDREAAIQEAAAPARPRR